MVVNATTVANDQRCCVGAEKVENKNPPSGVILELELVSSLSGEVPDRLEPPSRSPVSGKGEPRWGGSGVAYNVARDFPVW